MIGFFLILICLTIVFLTTPNARKKIRKMYAAFGQKLTIKIASYKRKYPKLFGVKKQLNSVEAYKIALCN